MLKKQVYISADKPASYPGGEEAFGKFILTNFHFKSNENLTETIKIGFVIDSTGSLVAARILNKNNKKLTSAESRALKMLYQMPKWEPAICNGKPIAFYRWVPIRY